MGNIVLTRLPDEIKEWEDALKSWKVKALPLVEYLSLDHPLPSPLSSYTFCLLTSLRGAKEFFQRQKNEEIPPSWKWFMVGEKSKNYLLNNLPQARIEGVANRAVELYPFLEGSLTPKDKGLYPCSEARRPELESFLTQRNITLDPWILYKPQPIVWERDILEKEMERADVLVFFSPSQVKHFLHLWGSTPPPCDVYAIGPTTASSLPSDWPCHTLSSPSPQALKEALRA